MNIDISTCNYEHLFGPFQLALLGFPAPRAGALFKALLKSLLVNAGTTVSVPVSLSVVAKLVWLARVITRELVSILEWHNYRYSMCHAACSQLSDIIFFQILEKLSDLPISLA